MEHQNPLLNNLGAKDIRCTTNRSSIGSYARNRKCVSLSKVEKVTAMLSFATSPKVWWYKNEKSIRGWGIQVRHVRMARLRKCAGQTGNCFR
jgi:hypothetical protein